MRMDVILEENKVLLVFTKIILWWNSVKLWTIDIGLWYYQEDIRKNPMKEQELNKDIFSLNR